MTKNKKVKKPSYTPQKGEVVSTWDGSVGVVKSVRPSRKGWEVRLQGDDSWKQVIVTDKESQQ